MNHWCSKLLLLLFSLPLTDAFGANHQFKCEHFWTDRGKGVPSGQPVGVDVGKSPFGNSGFYLCHISLTQGDLSHRKMIYIGEVGDASYFEVLSINGKPWHIGPITHGWSPSQSENPIYTRWLPFVVPIRDVFRGDGDYEIRISYTDIVPQQVGIRGGAPSVETLVGAIWRFVAGAPAFTYHFLQMFYLIVAAMGFLLWPRSSLKSRLLLCCAALLSSLVIFQITAIPRTFLSADLALKLTMCLQLVAFPVLAAAVLEMFDPMVSGERCFNMRLHFIVSWSAAGLIWLLPVANSNAPFLFLGIAGLFCGGAPLLVIANLIRRRKLLYNAGPGSAFWFANLLYVLGLLFFFDVINLTLLHGRFYYFNHFFYYSGIIASLRRMRFMETVSFAEFQVKLNELKEMLILSSSSIGATGDEDWSRFATCLGGLLGANRISILEAKDGKARIIGSLGLLPPFDNEFALRRASPLGQAYDSGSVEVGLAKSRFAPHLEGQYVVIPLVRSGVVDGFVCSTDFQGGCFSPFYRRHVSVLAREVNSMMELWQTRRQNAIHERLLDMIRHRTHPLQLRSEEHFLKHFRASPFQEGLAFIIGDVVDSTTLNELFGAQAVSKVIDAHLEYLWDKFKHLGVILSRDKGDFISLHVPCQVSDDRESEAVERCFLIASFLVAASDSFDAIARACGVGLSIRYRFAMSRLSIGKELNASHNLTVLSLLADEALDAAARALSSIALPNEVLVLDPAASDLASKENLLPLPPYRVKGKGKTLGAYLLKAQSQTQQVA